MEPHLQREPEHERETSAGGGNPAPQPTDRLDLGGPSPVSPDSANQPMRLQQPGGQQLVEPGTGWRSWTRDLLVSVAISVFIILFLYQPVRVEGTSMLPMLEDQDRLFINKFAYHFEDIHRGDVVVFLFPNDQTKSYIKRVIALPGDDLRIEHGTVWVNGRKLDESYVPLKYEDDRSMPQTTVPHGEYFVMGDHRSISSDSRDFGSIPRHLIYGKAAFVYWPMDQAGIVR